MALDWLRWRAWVPVDAVAAAAVGVAGVALGDIERRFCVAGAALGDMYVHSAWQAWHLWHWAGSGGALGSQLTPWPPRLFAWQAWYLATSSVDSAWQVWRHRLPLCVASVALMALDWLRWRAWAGVDAVVAAAVGVAGVALGDIQRRFCVAGVALGDIYVHSAWQAWHLWHWAGSAERRAWVPVDAVAAAAVGVAGVVLGDIERRFCVAVCGTW